MCGRFTRYLSWSEIVRLYRLTAPAETGRNDAPAYNVAPTDPVPFVTAGKNGALREGRSWRVSLWAKDMPNAVKNRRPMVSSAVNGVKNQAATASRQINPQ